MAGFAPSKHESAVADEDAALVARMGRADRTALGLLYDRYAAQLNAAAVRMLGSPREAQDLLHDVFLEAWEQARTYDAERGTVRAWLFVRLRSRALDRLGKAGRAREASLGDESVAGELARLCASNHTVDRIATQQALSRLPNDVRDALELTYFEGLTAKEIAERAGVPEGTIRSRLARGLAVLVTLLDTEKDVHDGG